MGRDLLVEKNIMNYNEFMKAVEEKLSNMSEEEKTKWIYNKARTAKENQRNEILNSLDKIGRASCRERV